MMIDLETLEKAEGLFEDLIPKVEGIVNLLNALKNGDETLSKDEVQALIDEIKAADTEEKKDAVLKKVLAYLEKALSYYPYPYPYAYKEKASDDNNEANAQTTEESESHEEDSNESDTSELEAKIKTLEEENEKLRAQLEEFEREKVLSERFAKLSEIENRDWSELKDVIAKLTDEEFDKFVKSIGKSESHSNVPHNEVSNESVFKKIRKQIKGGEE